MGLLSRPQEEPAEVLITFVGIIFQSIGIGWRKVTATNQRRHQETQVVRKKMSCGVVAKIPESFSEKDCPLARPAVHRDRKNE